MRTPTHHNQGFVLVTVLWMIAILTVIVLGFGFRAMLERRIAWYELDQAQAQAMARGAVNRALMELENKKSIDAFYQQAGYTGLDQHWATPVNLLDEAEYFDLAQDSDFDEESCTFTITDCERWISINDAPRDLLEALELFDFTTIDDLMDTRETKDRFQSTRLLSPDEVFGLEGGESIDEDLWYGTEDAAGIRSKLTLYGSARDGRININTASHKVLSLIPKLSESTLETIMLYRNGSDEVPNTPDDRSFTSIRALRSHLSTSFEAFAPIQKYCKTDSQWFKITTHATRRQGKINAYCTVIVEIQRNDLKIRQWKEGLVAQ